jgi:hypothetical protein
MLASLNLDSNETARSLLRVKLQSVLQDYAEDIFSVEVTEDFREEFVN